MTANAMALLIVIKIHMMIVAGRLPDGADARVAQLFHSLGCELVFDDLTTVAPQLAQLLCKQREIVMPVNLGEIETLDNVTPAQVESAMVWLDERAQRQPD